MEVLDIGLLVLVSFVILVNGTAKGWVKATIGLRQGDLLSQFLFTITIDILSGMTLRVKKSKLSDDFLMGRNRTRVSYNLQMMC